MSGFGMQYHKFCKPKWALLEPSFILSGCILPHSFGIVRGKPNKYPVGWCPANYDGCFCHASSRCDAGPLAYTQTMASLWDRTAWPTCQQNTRRILDLAAMASVPVVRLGLVCAMVSLYSTLGNGWLVSCVLDFS